MSRESIQKTLDYIDINVKDDLTAEDLAAIAGICRKRGTILYTYENGRGRAYYGKWPLP